MSPIILLINRDFKLLRDRQQKKCTKLELLCNEEEMRHIQELSSIQEKNKLAMSMFQGLDERINYIATKVIHLGNQLEAVNTPRYVENFIPTLLILW